MAAEIVAELLPSCCRAEPALCPLPLLCYRLLRYPGRLLTTSTDPQSNRYHSGESSNRLIQSHDPRQMNKQQTAAALQLVALLEGDLEAQANCTVYGNWFEHLTDHLADEHVEQLTLSCKQLHPVC